MNKKSSEYALNFLGKELSNGIKALVFEKKYVKAMELAATVLPSNMISAEDLVQILVFKMDRYRN